MKTLKINLNHEGVNLEQFAPAPVGTCWLLVLKVGRRWELFKLKKHPREVFLYRINEAGHCLNLKAFNCSKITKKIVTDFDALADAYRVLHWHGLA